VPEPPIAPTAAWLDSPRRRLLELLLVTPVVALAAPVMGVVAVAVARVMGRPVLFRQVRSGKGGQPVRIVKFRTMTHAVDEQGRLLPDADRLVLLGRFLRSTSLDELPQLWSIVSGETSLIGPRPLPSAYDERYSPEQARRLAVRPGLTGWAQVHGRNAISWPERLSLDGWYVDHATWRVDLSILVRTLAVVLTRSGVRAEGHATMPEFTGSSGSS
jgi:lipopolysaccharide/colanic/teichoic acid biosynthesis glycosyltransferase